MKAHQGEPDYLRLVRSGYYYLTALDYGAQYKLDKAEESFKKAIGVYPKDDRYYIGLGDLLAGFSGRADEAEKNYRMAIDLDPTGIDLYSPNGVDAYLGLGYLLKYLGRIDEAQKEFAKAIDLSPNRPDAYIALGQLLAMDRARAKEAEDRFRKSLQIDPKQGAAYYYLGWLLSGKNEKAKEAKNVFRKGIPYLEQHIQASPDDWESILKLASIQKRLGNKTEAEKLIAQARKLIPSADFYDLARLESISGSPETAMENLHRSAKSNSFPHEWATHDPDFEWIRKTPYFKAFVSGHIQSQKRPGNTPLNRGVGRT